MTTLNSRKRKAKGQVEPASTRTDISEEEQWRLIDESGVLNQFKTIPQTEHSSEEENLNSPLAEEIFNAIVIIIPISFLLLLMEILIHFQYGKHPTLKALVDRMASGVPIISIFIFYTTRYKSYRMMQTFLVLLGALAGSRMLYLLNRGSWLVNMRQCPPLATAWVYSIVQLELLPAVLSLGVVGVYVMWQGLSLNIRL